MPPENPLLTEAPVVINLGLDLFAEALAQQSVPCVQVRWTPPPPTDDDLLTLLDDLL
ncbi:hypothetical protein [Mesobacterium pallidum]|uniref:hypothetical protein n=1 Tax=Mesobacterium pallidum TaxID=2872037 RepID=UPI001EE230E3|nr:hypothetical protein [Mesobacterium pallidum]